MKRRVLNLVTALSLLLCLAVCAAWVRSLWCFDQVDRQRLDPQGRLRGVRVSSYRGALAVQASILDRAFVGAGRWANSVYTRQRGGPDWNAYDPTVVKVHAGFGSGVFRYRIGTGPPGSAGAQIIGGTARVWVVPWYALALVTAALPAGRAWRWWKRGRGQPPGSCRSCGYDLRATPGRCPECGALTAAEGTGESAEFFCRRAFGGREL